MESRSLTALVREHLANAASASAGRSAVTVYGGRQHDLRQTLIALTAGTALGEHEAPGEATLQVLEGRVVLHAGGEQWEGDAGDHVVIPPERHDLAAVTDAAVLLTVATRA
jgi:quercetin dioxygenase-like cupin family protein